jgi:hypothetical protein
MILVFKVWKNLGSEMGRGFFCLEEPQENSGTPGGVILFGSVLHVGGRAKQNEEPGERIPKHPRELSG